MMTLDELKLELKAILAIEQQVEIDWAKSEARCMNVIERLSAGPEPEYPHHIVYHFLDDPDVRKKDDQYASTQHQALGEWLDS